MKKLICVALAACLVFALMSGVASAQKKKRKPVKQEEEGSIRFPAPFVGIPSLEDGCFAGVHRRLVIFLGEGVNGVFGYHFEIDKRTWNRNFVLEPTGGMGTVDLDIFFYKDFGTVEDHLNNPPWGSPPVSGQFDTREAGGESGKVPEGMEQAIVCLYGGQAGYAGFDASFIYEAGRGVRLPKD